jgi:ATP-dependent DNA helicase RecG
MMRPEILNPLFAALTDLKGVGPQLAKPLARLGLERVIDALCHLPTGLITREPVKSLEEARAGQTIIVDVTAQDYKAGRTPRAPFGVDAFDDAGEHVRLVYFGRTAGLARKMFPLGEKRRISGRLDFFGEMRQIVHPDQVVEIGEEAAIAVHEPVYPLTEGLTNARLTGLMQIALERRPQLPEWAESSLIAGRSWPNWFDAMTRAHANPNDVEAKDRLAYDEILASQIALMLIRQSLQKRRGRAIVGDGHLLNGLRLPFGLTGAQERVGREIAGDMGSETPMLRMLQGDVGSGKTLVALRAMLTAVEAGTQAALLAPTEILARQHYATLQELLVGLPVNIAILTGRDKGKARESTLMGLADGSIHILIGTHAIFQEAVNYRDLSLVVVDEQHRFGVAQRLMLTEKAQRPPHLLVMTATPIPRTLLLANHGEMDVSRLDEMPPGRTPVDTRVISIDRLDEVIDGLARHLQKGEQAYWVCPLVAESEKLDLASAEDRAALLRERLGEARVGIVHGKMKGAEKDAVMASFEAGEIGVLVATTVIEVGVNVPNSSLMVVEHADRFGLAQLHQLRGRVGRGTAKSSCLLLRSQHLSETARERLALMRETNDGFVIAEKDLELRGGGELLGLKQSGDADYKLSTAEQLQRLLPAAHDDARLFVERDGGIDGKRGEAVRLCLYLFERDAAIPLLRSG